MLKCICSLYCCFMCVHVFVLVLEFAYSFKVAIGQRSLIQVFQKVKKKAKVRNRYNQVPHLTRDTIWKSDINTRKHHTQERQEVSPFQAGNQKAAKEQTRQYNKDKHET